MKVLLTGAFGNIGSSAVKELLAQNHSVRCFDIKTPATEKISETFKDKVEIFWGDLTKPENVRRAAEGMETVIHLAAIIPPLSEKKPEFSRKVNVDGTRNILNAIKAQTNPPRLIYSSSIAVFGNTQDLKPPRTVNDPVNPIAHYDHHKVECEKMIKESGLTWTILRFGAAVPLNVGNDIDPIMFEIALDTRIEFVHTWDVGLAVANAVMNDEVCGKTLIIAGGKKCQMHYRDFVGKALEAMSVGMLPDEAFAKKPYHTDWYDTEESERLLKFQRHTYDDFLREMAKLLGVKLYFAKLFRPFVRRMLLKKSPYYNKVH